MESSLTCREFVGFLADYLGGDLGPRRRAAFDAHLAHCPSCVSYMTTYRRAMKLVVTASAGEDEPLPADVPEELIRAILVARNEAS
jgi:anti-sigma factor RsiW